MARSQRARLSFFSLTLILSLLTLSAAAAEPKVYRLRGFEHLDVEKGQMVHVLELEGPDQQPCAALLTEPLELPRGAPPPAPLRIGARLEMSLTLIADDQGKPVYSVAAEPPWRILSTGQGAALEPRPRAALAASRQDLEASRRAWVRASILLTLLLFLGACACGALLSFGARIREG
jgi:hypothetical protein